MAYVLHEVFGYRFSDGMRGAARRPVLGAENVVRSVLGSLRKRRHQVVIETTTVNGRAGLAIVSHGAPGEAPVIGVVALGAAAGRAHDLWITMNPEKLHAWNGNSPQREEPIPHGAETAEPAIGR